MHFVMGSPGPALLTQAHCLPFLVPKSLRFTFLVRTSKYTSCPMSPSHKGQPPYPAPHFSLMMACSSLVLGGKRSKGEAGLSRLFPGGPETGLGRHRRLLGLEVWMLLGVDEPPLPPGACSL